MSKSRILNFFVFAILAIIVVLGALYVYIQLTDVQGELADLREQNVEMDTKIYHSNQNVEKLSKELQDTRKLIPSKSQGNYNVTATKLNIRTQAGVEYDSIGTVSYGTSLRIIDTSNPLWYEIELYPSEYKIEVGEFMTLLTNSSNDLFEIRNNYIKDNNFTLGNKYFVSSYYLTSNNVELPSQEVPKGDKPFTYGILFYDDATKALLEQNIWKNLKDKLTVLGYTGVNVLPVNRTTYVEDMKNGLYDAVESASGQFADVNKDTVYHEVFAKDLINGAGSYTGLIITNKNSKISQVQDLIGKNVLAYKQESESGYQIQKSYLMDEGIDAETDLKLTIGDYHQVIFYKVAKGEADAGFVGDFVMSDPAAKLKVDLAKSKIELSTDEIEDLRSNINIIELKGMKKIPNNPQSIKADLYKDKELVNALYKSVKEIYSKNKDGYDLEEATSDEYKYLSND